MDVRGLGYLDVIARTGGFRIAARTLGINQPGLTAKIRHLEQELGVQLLDRSHRPVRPTAAGEAILGRARDMLDQIERLEDDIRQIAQQHATARLNVGVTYQPASSLMAAFARFGELHPDIDVSLRQELTAELLRLIVDGDLDACIVAQGENMAALPPNCHSIRLFSPQWVFAVAPSHRLAQTHAVDIHDLQDERFILSSGGSGDAVKKAFADAGVRLHVAWETNGPGVVLNLVTQGVGIGYVPDYRVHESDLSLATFEVEHVSYSDDMVLAWVERPVRHEPLESFVEFVRSGVSV